MRRAPLLLFLISWISTFAVGSSTATPIDPGAQIAGELGAEAIAVHDVGPRQPQPFEAAVSDAAPNATVRLGEDSGRGPTPPRTASRSTRYTRTSTLHRPADPGRRIDSVLALTRARTGFLSAVHSTAPPVTHG